LRFENVTFIVAEIPFGNLPTILKIIDLGEIKRFINSAKSLDYHQKKRMKMKLTGNRTIEFSDCGFV
jgi:hypothetical protein